MWGVKEVSNSQLEILNTIAQQRGLDTQISNPKNIVFDEESIFSAPKSRKYDATTFDHFVTKILK